MKKDGFTILELLVFFFILFIVVIISIRVLLKKIDISTKTPAPVKELVCSCETNKVCNYEFKLEDKVKFASINLIGGGASGGTDRKGKGGGAGESKTVFYPYMVGKFYIVLGQGGKINGNKNGGATTIYKKVGNKYKLLDIARGGTYNNEICEKSDLDYSSRSVDNIDNIQKGRLPDFNQGTFSNCGIGGDILKDGKTGEVVIRW